MISNVGFSELNKKPGSRPAKPAKLTKNSNFPRKITNVHSELDIYEKKKASAICENPQYLKMLTLTDNNITSLPYSRFFSSVFIQTHGMQYTEPKKVGPLKSRLIILTVIPDFTIMYNTDDVVKRMYSEFKKLFVDIGATTNQVFITRLRNLIKCFNKLIENLANDDLKGQLTELQSINNPNDEQKVQIRDISRFLEQVKNVLSLQIYEPGNTYYNKVYALSPDDVKGIRESNPNWKVMIDPVGFVPSSVDFNSLEGENVYEKGVNFKTTHLNPFNYFDQLVIHTSSGNYSLQTDTDGNKIWKPLYHSGAELAGTYIQWTLQNIVEYLETNGSRTILLVDGSCNQAINKNTDPANAYAIRLAENRKNSIPPDKASEIRRAFTIFSKMNEAKVSLPPHFRGGSKPKKIQRKSKTKKRRNYKTKRRNNRKKSRKTRRRQK